MREKKERRWQFLISGFFVTPTIAKRFARICAFDNKSRSRALCDLMEKEIEKRGAKCKSCYHIQKAWKIKCEKCGEDDFAPEDDDIEDDVDG